MMGDSSYETNFTNKLLLTDRQVSKPCKEFANNLSVNVKLSTIQISKKVQPGRFISLSDMVRLPKALKKSEE